MTVSNTTHVTPEEYDSKIEQTIPFYAHFHEQTMNLIEAFEFKGGNWLDTGCGTGIFVEKAARRFDDFEFTLYDPSVEMIEQAGKRLKGCNQVKDLRVLGSENISNKNEFNVITAIQSHHYFHEEERLVAIQNCYEALKEDGVFISFENFAPNSDFGKEVVLRRWGKYQKEHGKSPDEVSKHLSRYGQNYFPIPIHEHIKVLQVCGFKNIEVFWLSYMQMGLYAVK